MGGLSGLNTLIEQSCKYSNNAVKCITTILALNLTAIKGTGNVNSTSYQETLILYADYNLISYMLTVLLCRMQNYNIHNSLFGQSFQFFVFITNHNPVMD